MALADAVRACRDALQERLRRAPAGPWARIDELLKDGEDWMQIAEYAAEESRRCTFEAAALLDRIESDGSPDA